MDNKDEEFEFLEPDDEEVVEDLEESNDGPVFEPSFAVSKDEDDIFNNIIEPRTVSNSEVIPQPRVNKPSNNEEGNKEQNKEARSIGDNDSIRDKLNKKDNNPENNPIPKKKEDRKDDLNNKDSKDKPDKDKKDEKGEDKKNKPQRRNQDNGDPVNPNVKDISKRNNQSSKPGDKKDIGDKKEGLQKKNGLDKNKGNNEKPTEEKGRPSGLDKKTLGGPEKLKIPEKRADKIRMRLDAGARSGNGYSSFAQKILHGMDSIMGRERVDALLERFGEAPIKARMIKIVIGIVHALLPVILIMLAVYMVFSPMIDALLEVDTVARNIANYAEKFKNLYKNGKYADSKEAFNAELKRLEKIYGDSLNSPLLMATTFYTDMVDGYDTRYDNIVDIMSDKALDTEEGQTFVGTLMKIVKTEIESIEEEADSTYDEQTGLLYTTGKVYRLKSLASHMFTSDFSLDPDDYDTEEITLLQWFQKYPSQVWEAFKAVLFDISKTLINTGLAITVSIVLKKLGTGAFLTSNPVGFIAGIVLWGVSLIIDFWNIMTTKSNLDRAKDDLRTLINTMFMGLLSIKSIDLSLLLSVADFPDEDSTDVNDNAFLTFLSKIKITYYKYQYNEERYKEYLREYYIPHNSDFDKFLSYKYDGSAHDASIESIINEIFDYETYFRELFYEGDVEFAEKYSEQCLGAIDKKLAENMAMPVDINTTSCIDFSGNNGYGYNSNGFLHNGIEINSKSTGNNEGDKVYSVYDKGTVVKSSHDKSMTCNGGCLEIQYNVSNNKALVQTYKFTMVYKGMSKDSVTLNTGDKVTKRQEIGIIGNADESENMGMPSLYVEFRNENNVPVDPTNLIVKCSGPKLVNYEGATTIEVPQSFKQLNQHTVTCFGGKGWYKSCNLNDNRTWGKGDGQKAIYNIWVEQGMKYRNGIAVINVDGIERYLVAVTSDIGRPGSVINAKFKDGAEVPMLVMDEKDPTDCNMKRVNGIGWGHATCDKGTLYCKKLDQNVCDPEKPGMKINVIEMEVDPNVYNSVGNVKTSTWHVEWDTDQPVVSFTNNGRILDDNLNVSKEFDLSGKGSQSGDTNNISSGGLNLCYPVGSSSKVEKYISEAIDMANNNAIGYSQTNRNLDPDVDCSSFVYYSLVNSGVIPKQDYAFNTSTIGSVLKANGFDELDYNADNLRKGDIIVNPNQGNGGHATIYIGDGKEAAAHKDLDGKGGDSSGNEVNIRNYTDKGLNYEKIYRIKYDVDDIITPNPGTNNPTPGTEETTYKITNGNEVSVISIKMGNYNAKTYTEMLYNNGIRENVKVKGSDGKEKNRWSGCCRGVAKTQACGMIRGAEIIQSQVENRFDSNCDADPPECSGRFNVKHCFASEAEMTKHVIDRINAGKPSIIHVSGASNDFKIKGLSKEQFYKKAAENKVSRHFVTAVGYIKGSDATDSLNLLYIDSANATYRKIGESRFILKTSDDLYNNKDMGCDASRPFSVIDVN